MTYIFEWRVDFFLSRLKWLSNKHLNPLGSCEHKTDLQLKYMQLYAKVGTERLIPYKSYTPKGRRFVPCIAQLLVLSITCQIYSTIICTILGRIHNIFF